ncbi:MAG: GAF domain-containing protein [Spirochaetia bacterium]
MGKIDPLAFMSQGVSVEDTIEETRRNIKLIIRIRWIVSPSVFLIMMIAYVAGFSGQESVGENQLVVNGINLGVMLVLNLAYIGLARRMRDLRPLILFQLLIDVFQVTLTVYKTGGVASPFGFLFFFVIFEAAILRSGGASYIVAAVSSVAFSLTALLTTMGILPQQDYFSPFVGLQRSEAFVVLSWAFSVASFFGFAALTAHLTGLLARRQRRLRIAYTIMKRRDATLMLMHRTSKALNSFEMPGEVVDNILGELLSHLNLHRALLYTVGSDGALHLFMVKERADADAAVETYSDSTLDLQASSGLNVTIPLESTAGLTARSAMLQEPYNIVDPQSSPHINQELAKRIGLNPFALAPMVVRGKTVGVIGIDRSKDNGAIGNEEFRILQVFADQAAITLRSVAPSAAVYDPTSG